MYTQFVIIYICLGFLILFSIVSNVLLYVILKRSSDMNFVGNSGKSFSASNGYSKVSTKEGAVFCKNCGNQFSGTRVCPRCGTMRQ